MKKGKVVIFLFWIKLKSQVKEILLVDLMEKFFIKESKYANASQKL